MKLEKGNNEYRNKNDSYWGKERGRRKQWAKDHLIRFRLLFKTLIFVLGGKLARAYYI
jgi:hypothetical protein